MFGTIIPPGVDAVRLLVLTGRKGKPPCIWEGPPGTEQSAIESQLARDNRIARWLHRNKLIQNGVATLKLQLEMFAQGKRVESVEIPEATFLMDKPKLRKNAGDEIAIRAFDLAEHMVDSLKEMLEERDTIVGRLVERGLKSGDLTKLPALPPPEPQKDTLDDLLDKGTKLLSLANSFRSMRDPN